MSFLAYVNFGWLLAAYLFYYSLRTLYRLYLHPLARFPGPKGAAVTGLWELFNDVLRYERGSFHLLLNDLHDRYGPIVRVTPNELHVKDRRWYRTLYSGARDKDPLIAHAFGSHSGLFGIVDHNKHKSSRKALNPLFTKSAATRLNTIVDANVESLCADLHHHHVEQRPINMYVEFLAWMMDFNTTYIFGEPMKLLGDRQRAEAWFATHSTFPTTFPYLRQCVWLMPLCFALPGLFAVLLPPIAPILRLYQSMFRAAKDAIKSNETEGNRNSRSQRTFTGTGAGSRAPNTLFQTLQKSNLTEEDKAPDQMAQVALEFFAAGSYSTSRILTFAIFHILDNPVYHARLSQELDEVMRPRGPIPDVASLESLPLLNALVKESLRISALITIRMGRITRAPLVYRNWIIPSGYPVSMTIADVLTDPEIYPEPEKFNPERWREPDPQKRSELERNLILFGTGSRACIGMHLAIANLFKAIAALFRRFDLQLHHTSRVDIDHKWGWFVGEPTRQSKGAFLFVKGLR